MSEERSVSKAVRSYVAGAIERLTQVSAAARRAALAKLRRGVGKTLDEAPETWEFVYQGLPDFGRKAEDAVFVALTLLALHSQSQAELCNKQGISFGAAVAKLRTPDSEKSLKRRFDAAVTSKSSEEFAQHVRGLIQLLRASKKDTSFDYPLFAEDLYWLQWPDARRRVMRKWGRDFYRLAPDTNNTTEKGDNHE